MTSIRALALGLLAAGLLLGLVGCGESPPDSPAAPPGAVLLDAERWLGESIEVSNLVVWPVYTSHPLDLGEFLTLEEAEASGRARVLEVQGEDGGGRRALNDIDTQQEVVEILPVEEVPPSETAPPGPQGRSDRALPGGQVRQHGDAPQTGQTLQIVDQGPTVGTLVIENDGDLPILVIAGTIVKGGQQDRQIGQDLVIAAHTRVPVEAFCVEPGRWQSREGMDGVALAQGTLGIATKRVRVLAQYAKDQQAVWDEVREVLNDKGIQATSTFVAAVEEGDPEAKARRDRVEQALRLRFAGLAATSTKPVGFAYAVNGEIQTVRAFAHPRLLADHLPAFVKAMALEADLARDAEKHAVEAADVAAFVRTVNEAQEAVAATTALNMLGTRENDLGYNGNCYVADPKDGTKRRALTVDWTAK